MMFTLHLYREGDRWFFDDVRKDIEHEEFVGGIPEILYEMADSARITKCDVSVSTQKLPGGVELLLADEVDPLGGVFYDYPCEAKMLRGWLCPVFWQYFDPPDAPKKLWVLMWVTEKK